MRLILFSALLLALSNAQIELAKEEAVSEETQDVVEEEQGVPDIYNVGNDNEFGPIMLRSGTVDEVLPDTMPSRLGEPPRFDLPHAWDDVSRAYKQKKGVRPVIEDLGDKGYVATNDTVQAYQLRKLLLDLHNQYRTVDAARANYMNKLIWDFHLEAFAEQWAKTLCTETSDPKYSSHSPDRSDHWAAWPSTYGFGENLSYNTNPDKNLTAFVISGMDDMYSEVSEWDFTNMKVKENPARSPGHFTQIVQQKAQYVGCSVVTGCRRDVVGDLAAWRTYLVCEYDWGNLADSTNPNAAPYSYVEGQACTTCPAGYTCCENNALCAGIAPYDSYRGEPFAAPTSHETVCNNWNRYTTDKCANTGASHVSDGSLPGDTGLAFNVCHCGKGPHPKNFIHTVRHGYTWFEGGCLIETTAVSDDKEEVDAPSFGGTTTDSGTSGVSAISDTVPSGTSSASTSGSVTSGSVTAGGSTTGSSTSGSSTSGSRTSSSRGVTPGAASGSSGYIAGESTRNTTKGSVSANSTTSAIPDESNASQFFAHTSLLVVFLLSAFITRP